MAFLRPACHFHAVHAKAPASAGAFSVLKVAVTVAALMRVGYVNTID